MKHQAADNVGEKEPRESTEDTAVFGVPLELAVKRSKCHDGICLPLVVRQCIDYIEEHGLMVEGVKSQIATSSQRVTLTLSPVCARASGSWVGVF